MYIPFVTKNNEYLVTANGDEFHVKSTISGFNIELYTNSAEPNRVNKSDFITLVDTLTGVLKEATSIIAPSILIEYSYPNFNYIYIPTFGRYYFVKNITSVNDRSWRIDLVCDVLMSFKDIILEQTGIIARQENDFNDMLNDPIVPAEVEPIIEIIEIPNDVFITPSNTETFNTAIITLSVKNDPRYAEE